MSQQDVYNFLKKNRGWFTVRELSEILGITCNNINFNIRRLKNRNIPIISRQRTRKAVKGQIIHFMEHRLK